MSKKENRFYDEPEKISFKKALTLLNDGHTLFVPGKNLDRLVKDGNEYSWGGLSDQQATVLNEKQIKTIIEDNKWVVDL
jgi:hypothetical protein